MTQRRASRRIEIYLMATGVEYALRADAEKFARARVALERIIGLAPQIEESETGSRLFVALDAAQHAAFGEVWKSMQPGG